MNMVKQVFSPIQFLIVFFIIIIGCNNKTVKSFIDTDNTIYKTADPDRSRFFHQNLCKDPANYIPDTFYMDHFRVRYVKVNFHFINNTAGTATFPEPNAKQYARDLLSGANAKMLQNSKMHLPANNETQVLPVLYQYILTPNPDIPGDDGIYYHVDDDLYFLNKSDKGSVFNSGQYNKFGMMKGDVVNVFLLEHPVDSVVSETYKVKDGGIGLPNWVKVMPCKLKTTKITGTHKGKPIYGGAWSNVDLLNHEMGHSLGLSHSWNMNDGCDDTPRNPNCWNYSRNAPCDKYPSNNMMDYNVFRNAVTPCQIGKIHANLGSDSPQRDKLVNDWCELNPEHDITIRSGDSIQWACHKDISGNITINNGGTITLFCNVSIPKDGKITVKPGGKLILDNATLYNSCKYEWEGIEIWSNRKAKGEVIIIGNAKILNAKNKVPVEEIINKTGS